MDADTVEAQLLDELDLAAQRVGLSGAMVDRVGVLTWPIWMSSTPTTATSCGTRRPSESRWRMAASARVSLKQKTASTDSGRASSRATASAAAANVGSCGRWMSAGSAAIPAASRASE